MRMRNRLEIRWAAVMLLCFALPATADTRVPEIAVKAGCMTCHAVDRKIIGPALGWVAHKYKDDKEKGRTAILGQIEDGGGKKWIRHTGGILMPPFKGRTSEEQRSELADFILNLAPIAPPE
jgi:cytochrome c